MSEITQEQVDQLVSKPKSEWTAADRVLLSKARKAGLKVELPEAAKSEPKPDPPKKEEAAPKKAAKPAEPETMGPYLQTLHRMRVGTEEASPDKINEIRSKAESLLKEVIEEMGKEDFSLEELAKKDITLRQRFERAVLIREALNRLEEPIPSAGGSSSLSRLVESMKERLSSR